MIPEKSNPTSSDPSALSIYKTTPEQRTKLRLLTKVNTTVASIALLNMLDDFDTLRVDRLRLMEQLVASEERAATLEVEKEQLLAQFRSILDDIASGKTPASEAVAPTLPKGGE